LAANLAEFDNLYRLTTGTPLKTGTTTFEKAFSAITPFNLLLDNYDFDNFGRPVYKKPYGPPLTQLDTSLLYTDKELDFYDKVSSRHPDVNNIRKYTPKALGGGDSQTIVELPEDSQVRFDISKKAADLKKTFIDEYKEGGDPLSLPKKEFEGFTKELNTFAGQEAHHEYIKKVLTDNNRTDLIGDELVKVVFGRDFIRTDAKPKSFTKENLHNANLMITKDGRLVKKDYKGGYIEQGFTREEVIEDPTEAAARKLLEGIYK
jgi:hypothetical protein